MTKKYLLFLAACCVVSLASAEVLELNPEHPHRYVVKRGDTLWNIAGVFLKEPWRWPELWRANPRLRNPNRIYPGDELRLSLQGGQPRLQLSRGRDVKLSPSVRSSAHGQAIPPIPLAAIWPFLSRPKVVGPEELAAAPYIVSSQDTHLVNGSGDRVYVRGALDPNVKHYTVVRCGEIYRDPPRVKDADYRYGLGHDVSQDYSRTCSGAAAGPGVLGFEALHVADAAVVRHGDPATAVISSSQREVLIGDRLIPATDGNYPEYVPHAPERPVTGSIIAIMDAVSQVGRYQVVALNRGAGAGLEPGHVLAIHRSGVVVRDDVVGRSATGRATRRYDQGVELPNERIGELMVFRTFPKVSYALVMRSERSVYRYDEVANP